MAPAKGIRIGGNFAASISTFVEKTKVNADYVLRKIAMDCLEGVIMKSPVDTGRFRASWRVGINSVDLSVEEAPPPKTKPKQGRSTDAAGRMIVTKAGESNEPPKVSYSLEATLSDGASKIETAKFGDSITVSNNLPYAERLENGWSQQAPQGMLKLTFEEVKAGFEATVEAVKG